MTRNKTTLFSTAPIVRASEIPAMTLGENVTINGGTYEFVGYSEGTILLLKDWIIHKLHRFKNSPT